MCLICAAHMSIHAASGKRCTDGLWGPQDKVSGHFNFQSADLIPLLGRSGQGLDYGLEQWIFPDLKFTCQGRVTQWVFKGEGSAQSSCRVQLATWRLSIDPRFLVYGRVSTTQDNIARVRVTNGSIFTYELTTPVPVQPGDIVGIEIPSTCGLFEIYNNVLSLNVTNTSSTKSSFSYSRFESGSVFQLESPLTHHQEGYHPLVEAVIGEL